MARINKNEKNSLQASYETTIAELENSNKDLGIKNERLEKLLKTKQEAFDIKTYREEKLVHAFELFKQQYAALKEELFLVKEENRVYKIRIQNMQNIKSKPFQKYKTKTPEVLNSKLKFDPILNFHPNDDTENLIEKISQYGNKNSEKLEESFFQAADFKDQSSNTDLKEVISKEQNTEVCDLCGESVGIKIRRRKRTKVSKNTDLVLVIPIISTLEKHPSEKEENIKAKHNFVKQMLGEINEVIVYQENCFEH